MIETHERGIDAEKFLRLAMDEFKRSPWTELRPEPRVY